MNLQNDGLSLWYGTPDAPAPGDGGAAARRGASVIMGVQPPNPTNTALVRYRVDGGIIQLAAGREVRVDLDRQVQYFEAKFPEFVTGDVVEYAPVVTCGGRQVPAPPLANDFRSRFRLAPAEPRLAKPPPAPPVAAGQQWAAEVKYLGRVAVQFAEPEYVGETADGVRVNFFVERGTIEGGGLHGTVVRNSADHMIVRRDGMGEVRIRAVFETDDGAVLDVESGGYADFGPDAYRLALARALPDRAELAVTPLISTRHPRYKWLSRIQCVGVGFTHLDARQASYEVFATSTRLLK